MAHTDIDACKCCGGTGTLAYYTNSDSEVYSVYVTCEDCGLRTKAIVRDVSYDAEEEAIALWNATVSTTSDDDEDTTTTSDDDTTTDTDDTSSSEG